MKVEVTQEDIDNGERGSRTACPIALSLCRQFPDGVEVVYTYWWPHGSVRHSYRLSQRASRFIKHFDAGKPVKPFKFITRRPDA